MQGIDKAFPASRPSQGVDFALAQGEIHALVGENGAGKSTLIKVLTGVERPDAGTITLAGEEVAVRSPQHAQALGISTVYQEVNLCPNLTVGGEHPDRPGSRRRWGRIDWRAMNRRADEILRGLDIDIDVTQPLGSYSVAIQQMAAIARALEISSAKVLILDEPTSSLDAHETEQLFGVMRKLRGEGIAIVFITHFLDQVYEVSDRVTVLRNGRLVGTYPTAGLPRLELITLMLGRELTELDDMAKIKLESGQAASATTRCSRPTGSAGRARSSRSTSSSTPARSSAWPACSARAGPRSPSSCSASTSRTAGRSAIDGDAGQAASRRSGSIEPRRRALPGGPQGRGDRRRPDRPREHHPGHPGQPRLAPATSARRSSTRSPTATSSCSTSRRRPPTSRSRT